MGWVGHVLYRSARIGEAGRWIELGIWLVTSIRAMSSPSRDERRSLKQALPPGWEKQEKKSRTGDPEYCYVSPEGKRFRSVVQVWREIEARESEQKGLGGGGGRQKASPLRKRSKDVDAAAEDDTKCVEKKKKRRKGAYANVGIGKGTPCVACNHFTAKKGCSYQKCRRCCGKNGTTRCAVHQEVYEKEQRIINAKLSEETKQELEPVGPGQFRETAFARICDTVVLFSSKCYFQLPEVKATLSRQLRTRKT